MSDYWQQPWGNKRPGEKHAFCQPYKKFNPCMPSVSKNWEIQGQRSKGVCILRRNGNLWQRLSVTDISLENIEQPLITWRGPYMSSDLVNKHWIKHKKNWMFASCLKLIALIFYQLEEKRRPPCSWLSCSLISSPSPHRNFFAYHVSQIFLRRGSWIFPIMWTFEMQVFLIGSKFPNFKLPNLCFNLEDDSSLTIAWLSLTKFGQYGQDG